MVKRDKFSSAWRFALNSVLLFKLIVQNLLYSDIYAQRWNLIITKLCPLVSLQLQGHVEIMSFKMLVD